MEEVIKLENLLDILISDRRSSLNGDRNFFLSRGLKKKRDAFD